MDHNRPLDLHRVPTVEDDAFVNANAYPPTTYAAPQPRNNQQESDIMPGTVPSIMPSSVPRTLPSTSSSPPQEQRTARADRSSRRPSKNPAANAWKFFLNTTVWGEGSDDENEKPLPDGMTNRRRSRRQAAPTLDSASASSQDEKHNYMDDDKTGPLTHTNTASTTITTFEAEGDGLLYRDGQLVIMPAATKDPRDPLNLPTSRKLIALFFLCFYGALAAAAELILGAMLPVFALEYAGINPKVLLPILSETGGLPAGSDPLETLSLLPGAPPIWHIYLLASLPLLMIGVSNLFLIPLAIAVGRRAIVLGCGIIAITGAVWAGFSQSLGSHLGARVVQALGAGTVESLIPFIIQDIAHVHQRNTYISGVFAAQGIIIISIGIGSPYMIINLSWRWVYFMTAAAAAFFLVGVAIFLPETRWQRTKAEMNGIPRNEPETYYPPRTWAHDLALFHGKKEWRKGWNALINTFKTFFYPQIFFITMLNSAMIACAFAAGFTTAPALLTAPWSWPFLHLGLCLLPILVAAIFVGVTTGWGADKIANWVAKKRGKREPENQLLNLILPTMCALIGSIIFGLAGEHQDRYPWMMMLMGLAMMAFGFLGANTVGAVYVLECYPHLAGPALVNIASFRCLIAFALSFKVSEWVAELGYLDSMLIYTGLMGFFAMLIPIVYKFGPAWRRRWPATKYHD